MQPKLGGPPGNGLLGGLRKIEVLRDRDLSLHETNVGRVCEILCVAIGLDAHFAGLLKLAAELHDIGKLAISDEILNRSAALDASDWAVVRTHCQIGHDILIEAGDPVLDFASSVALAHHEHYDGSGYPRGLRGDAIPLGCRIVALCDVYDALRADRPYRRGITHEAALAVLTASEGRACRTNFDPAMLAGFIKCGEEIVGVYADLDDRSRHTALLPAFLQNAPAAPAPRSPTRVERDRSQSPVPAAIAREPQEEALPHPITAA